MSTDVRTLENFVGGRWVAASTEDAVDDLNPADPGDVLARVPLSTTADAEAAIAAAAEAFPEWKAMSPIRRGQIFVRASRLIEERQEEIARLITREQGKTLAEARGEVPRVMQFMAWIGHQGGSITGITAPTESDRMLGLTLREPLGVVGLITPWNFPFNIPSWKLGSSLICGNTVVLKPAQLTPLTAIALVQALHDAGLPEGVVNLVLGSGRVVGETLVTDPRVKAISFTGSTAVGVRHQRQGGRARQEGAGRDGRPQRGRRARGRRPRAGGEGLRDGRLRDDRTALHGAAADHRGQSGGRPAHGAARRGDAEGAGRPRRRRGIRHRSDGRRVLAGRCAGVDRARAGRRGGGRGRRRPCGERGRLLPRADAPREGRPLDDDRERGGVRPGASGHGGRRLRRGARRCDLHPLRALGLDLHERPERCDPLHAGDGCGRRAHQQAPDRRREPPPVRRPEGVGSRSRRSSARWPTSTRRRRPSTSTTPDRGALRLVGDRGEDAARARVIVARRPARAGTAGRSRLRRGESRQEGHWRRMPRRSRPSRPPSASPCRAQNGWLRPTSSCRSGCEIRHSSRSVGSTPSMRPSARTASSRAELPFVQAAYAIFTADARPGASETTRASTIVPAKRSATVAWPRRPRDRDVSFRACRGGGPMIPPSTCRPTRPVIVRALAG